MKSVAPAKPIAQSISSAPSSTPTTTATGIDTLMGSLAQDVFNFNYGDGDDVVFTGDTYGHDWVRFDIDFARMGSHLTAYRSGDDLAIGASGTLDTVTIRDWFLGQRANVAAVEGVYDPGYTYSPESGGIVVVLPRTTFVNREYSADYLTTALMGRSRLGVTLKQTAVTLTSAAASLSARRRDHRHTK